LQDLCENCPGVLANQCNGTRRSANINQ